MTQPDHSRRFLPVRKVAMQPEHDPLNLARTALTRLNDLRYALLGVHSPAERDALLEMIAATQRISTELSDQIPYARPRQEPTI